MPDFAEKNGVLVPRRISRKYSGEIATPRNSNVYPVYGDDRVRTRDHTLRTKVTQFGESSYAIYDDVLRDPHAYAVMQKRYMEIIGRKRVVHPGSERRKDKKVAEMVERHLDGIGMIDHKKKAIAPGEGFDSVALGMLSAILKGFSVGEVLWAKNDNEIYPKEIRVKDQRRFTYTYDEPNSVYELRLLTHRASYQGMVLPARKFITHVFHGEYDNPLGYGLGEKLYWPAWFKKNGIRFWLMFADKFGSPTAVGKIPNLNNEAEEEKLRSEMLSAINKIAQEAGVVIPEDTAIEYLEATRTSTTDTYESLAKYMDSEMSKAVLGETGSTDQGGEGGSRARDEVGNSVRISIAKMDADLLASTFNRTLIRWICDFNYPAGSIKYPYIEWQFPELEEKEDLNERVGRDQGLLELGWRMTPDKVEQIYGDGYVPSTGDEDQEEPPLVATLGVGGTTSLMQFLSQSGELPRENAIAVLINVFGVSEDAAESMVPESEEEDEAPGLDDELASIFGGVPNSDVEESQPDEPQGVEGVPNVELSEGDRPRDIATLYAEQAVNSAQTSINEWTEQINAIVQDINNGPGSDEQKYADLEERLYSLYSEIDGDEYANVMGEAIASAEFAGRYEVIEGLSSDDIDFSEFVDFVEALEFQERSKAVETRVCNPSKSFCAGKSCQSLRTKKDGTHRVYSADLSESGLGIQQWLTGNRTTDET